MAKGEEGPNKRRKLKHDNLLPSGNIRGAFELHNLLRFKQNGGPEVKAGIEEFKNFLTEVQRNENLSERQIQLKVLKQYCDEQSLSNGEELDFPDLLSAWSFAAQSNHEAVLSAVPAAVSQFFRTISSQLEFREFGLSLCQSLLRRDQVKLFERGFSSPKSKAYLISPCLRLLTDVVSFDGGAVAGNVFSRRDILLKRFDALLDPPAQKEEDRRRPTVRSNALRLLMALLKYLDVESKQELVAQAKTLNACFKNLLVDDPRLVRDILQAIRRDLIDTELSKDSKKRLLNSNNLGLLASLYDYDEDAVDEEDAENQPSIRESVHNFLAHVCTSSHAVYVEHAGWYPTGFDAEKSTVEDTDNIDLGLDSPYYSDDYSIIVPVKNTTLSTFLQKLKPATDTLQAELMAKILEHAPELVADYFCRRPKPQVTPKDGAEWRGQFAFLFSVVNLPVPKNCGWRDQLPDLPPPLSIVLESVLPRQLDRVTLNQCLKSDDEIMVISAARLLVAVMEKMKDVQKVFQHGLPMNEMWMQTCQRLSDMLIARVPSYQKVIAALQKTSVDNTWVREALLDCMAAYNRVLPRAVAGSKFDIGPVLVDVLERLETGDMDDDQSEKLSSQLISAIQIASSSRTTKWWHKASAEQLSPIVRTLAYAASQNSLNETLRDHVMPLLLEKGILHTDKAFWAFLASLKQAGSASAQLFFENCMMRVMKQPVKYLEKLEEAQNAVSNKEDVSLLAFCVAEQWNFVKTDDVVSVGKSTSRFFALLMTAGESLSVIDHLQQHLLAASDEEARAVLKKQLKGQKKHPPTLSLPCDHERTPDHDETVEQEEVSGTHTSIDLSIAFPPPTPIPATLQGLTRWDKVDFESEFHAASSSRLASLILCLSSPTQELRLGAQQTLLSLTLQLQTSTYVEKDQVYLLLGELAESAREHTATSPSTPIPTLIPSLAIFLLSIVTSPSHAMYSTANRFLMRAPSWTPLTRLIPYWVDAILLSEPDSDDASAPQVCVNRFLDLLIPGLRTVDDMELYRKSGVFERVCSLYLAPATRRDAKKKVLQLIYQAIMVEGGSGADTLITRAGIRGWFAIVRGREGESELGRMVTALAVLLEERKGKEYITKWESARLITKEEENRGQ